MLSENSNGIKYGPSYESTPATTAAQVIAGIGIFAGFIIILFSGSPAQDPWSIIHFLQSVLVLPLMAMFMDNKVKDFIASNVFAAF